MAPASSDGRVTLAWRAYHNALQSFEDGRLQQAAAQLPKIEQALSEIPSRFLAEHVNRELARHNRRRSTDKEGDTWRGVIKLSKK